MCVCERERDRERQRQRERLMTGRFEQEHVVRKVRPGYGEHFWAGIGSFSAVWGR